MKCLLPPETTNPPDIRYPRHALEQFTIFQDKRGRYRWHAKRNGRITADCAQGNGYATRAGCEKALRRFLCAALNGAFVFTWLDWSRKTSRNRKARK